MTHLARKERRKNYIQHPALGLKKRETCLSRKEGRQQTYQEVSVLQRGIQSIDDVNKAEDHTSVALRHQRRHLAQELRILVVPSWLWGGRRGLLGFLQLIADILETLVMPISNRQIVLDHDDVQPPLVQLVHCTGYLLSLYCQVLQKRPYVLGVTVSISLNNDVSFLRFTVLRSQRRVP